MVVKDRTYCPRARKECFQWWEEECRAFYMPYSDEEEEHRNKGPRDPRTEQPIRACREKR